jgi:hypothetical protein
MQPCIENVLGKIRPKIRALLRLQHLYSPATMLDQYKSHIWSSKEYSNGALIMAAPHQLRRLDKVQRWYLHELALTDTGAFTSFNFAPPSLRRAIGMLGFIHKRTLGICHPLLLQALPFAVGLDANYNTKALDPFSGGVHYHGRLYERSLYMYILIYNRLPQVLVDLPSVAVFQAKLTHLAKHKALVHPDNWRSSFQSTADVADMFYS